MPKKLTTNQFITKALQTHGTRYDYSKVQYFGIQTKIKIICKEHGEFLQTPSDHIHSKAGCPECGSLISANPSNKSTIQQFVCNAIKLHNNKYDYSKVEYKNTKTKVCIICPTHGEFFQTPNSHLRGQGCSKCTRPERLSIQTFITRSNKIHNNKYDYSKVEYKNFDQLMIIICPIHGEFQQNARTHMQLKCGCKLCGYEQNGIGRRTSQQDFIDKANLIHNNIYSYENVAYVGGNKKVKIICCKHGEFLQTPECHLAGRGCPICGNERKGGLGGYTLGWFDIYPEQKTNPAMLYIIEMTCNTDNFIKVGITQKGIKQRYSRSGMNDNQVKKNVLFTKYTSLYEAFKLEQQILSQLKEYKYFPNYVIDGKTECLKNKPEVIQAIREIIK